MIPLVDMRPHTYPGPYRSEICEALDRVIASGQFVKGPEVGKFEEEWAEWCGAKEAVGVANGTAALELTLRAFGVGPGDHVLVPALSFMATAEAVANLGAEPIFVDVEKNTGNIEPLHAREAALMITRAHAYPPKACIAVALYGAPPDLLALKRYLPDGVTLILDAAQAHGAIYRVKMPRSDELELGIGAAAVACWSFFPGKNLGAWGDAGAVTVPEGQEGIALAVRMFRNHGRSPECSMPGSGTNARMDEMQAAILRVKLGYLERAILRRGDAALAYSEFFADLAPNAQPDFYPDPDAVYWAPQQVRGDHAWHVYTVRVWPEYRDRMVKLLRERGIGAGVHYSYILPELQSFGGHDGNRWPNASAIASSTLSLPLFPEISTDQVAEVVRVFGELYGGLRG